MSAELWGQPVGGLSALAAGLGAAMANDPCSPAKLGAGAVGCWSATWSGIALSVLVQELVGQRVSPRGPHWPRAGTANPQACALPSVLFESWPAGGGEGGGRKGQQIGPAAHRDSVRSAPSPLTPPSPKLANNSVLSLFPSRSCFCHFPCF